jgi:hypothetical protein
MKDENGDLLAETQNNLKKVEVLLFSVVEYA